MNKVNLLLMRFVILAASAFIAVLLALLPSLFVQYALPSPINGTAAFRMSGKRRYCGFCVC